MDIKNTRIAREIAKHMRNGRFEETPAGLLIDRGGMNALCNGAFKHTLYRGDGTDSAIDPNLVVNEGLDKLLNVMFNGDTPITAWYITLFSGDVTPAAGWTGASWVGIATEQTNYTPTARPDFIVPASTAQSIGNTGDEALFTITGSGRNAYGAALVSQSAKGAGGVLFAATRFASPRLALAAPDKLGVEYVITAADAG